MINWFIEKLRGLADLSDEDVRALELATNQPRFQATRGPHPGRRPARTCVHRSGRVGSPLQGAAQQLAAYHGVLIPGDACDLHIGLLAAMDHSIQTVTHAEVVKIEAETMDELMAAHPSIARAMYVAQLVDETFFQPVGTLAVA